MPRPGTFDLLDRAARSLVRELDASACAISRVLGDVLVQVAEHIEGMGTLRLGIGYLVPDYPETQAVLELRESRTVSLAEPAADPAEATLLRELGYGALVMLPLVADDVVWGLVEIYRPSEPFSPADVERAEDHVGRLGDELAARLR